LRRLIHDFRLPPSHPEALAFGRQHRGVIGEAVQQGGGEFLVHQEMVPPATCEGTAWGEALNAR
jgi:hypothetical protein